MMYASMFILSVISVVRGGHPIMDLKLECPTEVSGQPSINLISDVSAYAVAKCVNGDNEFETVNKAIHRLVGTFDPLHGGESCIFNHFKGNNSYMLDVEVGWGEDNALKPRSRIHTVTCPYDVNGQAMTPLQSSSHWFPTPAKNQKLLVESLVTANIRINILDENDLDTTWSEVPVGTRIRLRAYDTPGSGVTFRPLNCVAVNAENRYAILIDGCGDGLIIDHAVGFKVDGLNVYSPFFDAFHLPDAPNLQFVCNFTICDGACDGDTCMSSRKKRALIIDGVTEKKTMVKHKEKVVVVKSDVIKTKYHVHPKGGKERKMPKLQLDNTDVSDFLNHLGSLNRNYPAMKPSATKTSPTKTSLDQLATTEFLKVTAFITAIGVLIVFFFTAFVCYSLEFERYKTKTILG